MMADEWVIRPGYEVVGGPVVYRPGHPLANSNGMVPRALAGDPPRARSDLSGPMVISDAVEVRSMVDGKVYDSKSRLRRSYRDHGVIEVGNEPLKPKAPPKPDRMAVRDSVRKAASRVGIPTC